MLICQPPVTRCDLLCHQICCASTSILSEIIKMYKQNMKMQVSNYNHISYYNVNND